jgi:hypothetical protein
MSEITKEAVNLVANMLAICPPEKRDVWLIQWRQWARTESEYQAGLDAYLLASEMVSNRSNESKINERVETLNKGEISEKDMQAMRRQPTN